MPYLYIEYVYFMVFFKTNFVFTYIDFKFQLQWIIFQNQPFYLYTTLQNNMIK